MAKDIVSETARVIGKPQAPNDKSIPTKNYDNYQKNAESESTRKEQR